MRADPTGIVYTVSDVRTRLRDLYWERVALDGSELYAEPEYIEQPFRDRQFMLIDDEDAIVLGIGLDLDSHGIQGSCSPEVALAHLIVWDYGRTKQNGMFLTDAASPMESRSDKIYDRLKTLRRMKAIIGIRASIGVELAEEGLELSHLVAS